MPSRHVAPRLLALLLGLTVLSAGPTVRAQRPGAVMPAAPDDATLLHVLDRLTFGPRPGDLDRLRDQGIAAFIEQQLAPERIDDGAVESRLAGFATLGLGSRDIARDYVLPAIAERRRQPREAGSSDTDRAQEPMRPAAPATPSGPRLVLLELSEQKVLRALYSERQLQEVLTDFWFNHFNVFFAKGATGIYVTEYERKAIRPHVLGRFRDLLGATARSPAMLFYLDNWQNTAPRVAATPAGQQREVAGQRLARRPRGINENYARELMELHTLGVDGGYTQRDVQEVARAFTGWTVSLPRQGGAFRFEPRLHDAGAKTVLGHAIAAGGGQADGERVLDILASHPSTARVIAAKLARRFVSDDPPVALVDRVARRFTDTDGDLREVVRAIVTSPEFFAAAARRAKVKSPFEFVVSAARAVDAQPLTVRPLVAALRELGMPLYLCQPPTGYGDRADAWVNTGALLDRMNFAVALTGGGRTGGGRPAPRRPPTVTAERLVRDVFAGHVSEATTATVARAGTPAQAVALLLGSPDFQRR